MLQARTQFTDIFTAKRTSPAYECTCAHAKTLSTAYLPCWHATSSVCCNAQPNPYKQIRPCRYLVCRLLLEKLCRPTLNSVWRLLPLRFQLELCKLWLACLKEGRTNWRCYCSLASLPLRGLITILGDDKRPCLTLCFANQWHGPAAANKPQHGNDGLLWYCLDKCFAAAIHTDCKPLNVHSMLQVFFCLGAKGCNAGGVHFGDSWCCTASRHTVCCARAAASFWRCSGHKRRASTWNIQVCFTSVTGAGRGFMVRAKADQRVHSVVLLLACLQGP